MLISNPKKLTDPMTINNAQNAKIMYSIFDILIELVDSDSPK